MSPPGTASSGRRPSSLPAWSQRRYAKALNPDEQDTFGVSVAIAGDAMLAGAAGEDSAGSDPADNSALAAGAIYALTAPFRGFVPLIMRP